MDAGFGPRWFRGITPLVDAAWNGVSLEDLRFPELARHRPARLLPLQWYMGRVTKATHRSPLVANQFYRVINFLDPPASLFRPRVLAEVVLGGLRPSTPRGSGEEPALATRQEGAAPARPRV